MTLVTIAEFVAARKIDAPFSLLGSKVHHYEVMVSADGYVFALQFVDGDWRHSLGMYMIYDKALGLMIEA